MADYIQEMIGNKLRTKLHHDQLPFLSNFSSNYLFYPQSTTPNQCSIVDEFYEKIDESIGLKQMTASGKMAPNPRDQIEDTNVIEVKADRKRKRHRKRRRRKRKSQAENTQRSECESDDSFIVFEELSQSLCESTISDDVTFESEPETPIKKVCFVNDKNLCTVHKMIKWAFAYQNARKGQWEQAARDRERFRRRIHDCGSILNYALTKEHRARIFNERFT